MYFFEKATLTTYFTESTCANSVLKDANGYNVLSHLGHGDGFSEIKTVSKPTELTLAKSSKIGKIFKGAALGYTDKSNSFTKKLDLNGIQIFSSFNYKGKLLFMVHLAKLTFIAEIMDNEIKVVHRLFFNGLYTHHPITTIYGNYTLINLDHYSTGLHREISVLLITDNKITKLDWNMRHNH
ncbi:hypothetical protein CHU92_03045 [Flavobacterium cyanobacteriorum]|uniref:Uncharacterized protein n=1 Tax=Flavobacterium cyanobacteriorum TaxID=2022802 RepID=A0A255ZS42_9FLAO|nr:hypothetical protein [Flavobacterium cyanobacteriorum]OYQ43695.1 hypothetical protein CHU92_03045 [Flavobacterium cyanobacteriorum]